MDAPVPLDEFLQDEAGCRFDWALKLAQLQSAADNVYAELDGWPDTDPEILAACKLIAEYEFTV